MYKKHQKLVKMGASPSVKSTIKYKKLNVDSNMDATSNKEYCYNCGPNMMHQIPFFDMMSNALAVSSKEQIDRKKDAQRYYIKMQ